jgi:hypothetical protein
MAIDLWDANIGQLLEQLKRVFIPQTVPRDPREPCLLILDSYRSYKTTEFI